MLPSLCRLCIITDGSRRESDIDPPALAGFWDPVKLLMEALRLYSSSTARRLRCRRNKKSPAAIAHTAAIPTTTPAMMPAVFGPLDFSFAGVGAGAVVVWPGAVTTTVFPMVTTDGVGFNVVLGTGAEVVCGVVAACDVDVATLPLLVLDVDADVSTAALDTIPPTPVKATDQALSPPPNGNSQLHDRRVGRGKSSIAYTFATGILGMAYYTANLKSCY